MKTKRLLVSLLFLGMLGMISSVFAFQKDQFQGEFFNTRIKTAVKKNHSIDVSGSEPHSLNGSKVTIDSGKNQCYSGLDWLGDALNADSVDVNQYQLLTVCQTAGAWEWDGTTSLELLINGSLGTSLGFVSVPLEGTSFYSSSGVAANYIGTVVLQAAFKSDGSTKSIKLIQPKDGTVLYSHIGTTGIEGTGPSGLTMKWVNLTQVPEGAQKCFNAVIDPTDTTDDPKCPLAEWQTVTTP
ncbi:MAG: hypothetical protein ACXWTH_07765 [Methylosarcina sp.]